MSKKEEGKDNVIGISKGKKKKERERTADYHRTMIRHINHQHTNLFEGETKDFPHTYMVEEVDDGSRKLLIDTGNKTVKYISKDHFVSSVMKFTSDYLRHHEYFGNILRKKAEDIHNDWMMLSAPIKNPTILGLKSTPGYCFHRLDFDAHQDFEPQDYSAINKLLKNTHNREAVKHFIGSLFDRNADIQQVLVLYGEGMNGKSTLLNFLCRCLGECVTSSSAPNSQTIKNFTSQFVGKRVGIFPDAASLDFMQYQEFKMMTGGDLVPIDEKWGKKYARRLSCKFIISSNHKPTLAGQKSDSRRIIYYEMPEVERPDPKFIDDLYEQREAIFCHCIDMYNETVGAKSQIPVESDQLDGILRENSTEEEEFFDKYFVAAADGYTSVKTIGRCIDDHFGVGWRGKKKFKQSFDLFVRRVLRIEKPTNHRGNQGGVYWGYRGYELSNGNAKYACSQSSVCSLVSNCDVEERLKWHKKQIEIIKEQLAKKREVLLTTNNSDDPFFN